MTLPFISRLRRLFQERHARSDNVPFIFARSPVSLVSQGLQLGFHLGTFPLESLGSPVGEIRCHFSSSNIVIESTLPPTPSNHRMSSSHFLTSLPTPLHLTSRSPLENFQFRFTHVFSAQAHLMRNIVCADLDGVSDNDLSALRQLMSPLQ